MIVRDPLYNFCLGMIVGSILTLGIVSVMLVRLG